MNTHAPTSSASDRSSAKTIDQLSPKHQPILGHSIPALSSPLRLQTKLTVNTPGDQYEQEADRIAGQVTRMASPISRVSQRAGVGEGTLRRKELPQTKRTPKSEQKADAELPSEEELTTRLMRCIGIWETNRGGDEPDPKESDLDTVAGTHASLATIEQATIPYSITALKRHPELRALATPPLTIKELREADARVAAVEKLLKRVNKVPDDQTVEQFLEANRPLIDKTGLPDDDIQTMFDARELRTQLANFASTAEHEAEQALEAAKTKKLRKSAQKSKANAAREESIDSSIDAMPTEQRLGLGKGSLRAYTKKPKNWGEHRVGWQRKAASLLPDNIGQRIEAVATSSHGTALAAPVIRSRVHAEISQNPQPSLEEIVKTVGQQNNANETNYGQNIWRTYKRLYSLPTAEGKTTPVVQPKLNVNTPGDKYEQEADRVAEHVMRMPDQNVSRQRITGQRPLAGERFERKEEKREALGSLQRAATSSVGGISAPPIVDRVLASPGSPLPESTRTFMESRFGEDFSHVRVHTDSQAAESAEAINARAYTVGHNIVFGAGESPSGDHRLLAHELTHTVQQVGLKSDLKRQVKDDSSGNRQVRPTRVIAVGSPSPAEIKAGHPFQFVHAAMSHGIDESTVVLVERTGYELAGIDVHTIERMLSPSQVQWITPKASFLSLLNRFDTNSISSLHVFSHGVPGSVTLRYGWDIQGSENYGLSIPDIHELKKDLFTQSARIEFDSCNSGTSDAVSPQGSLAQSFAVQSGRTVYGWTGRTSYSSVNDAQGEPAGHVEPSEMLRGWRPWHPTRVDWTEVASRAAGRKPELRAFKTSSGKRTDGFESTFVIRMRLPRSRTFTLAEGGSVVVTCSNTRYVLEGKDLGPLDSKQSGQQVVEISMQREGGKQHGSRLFPVAEGAHRETWSNLSEGTYFLEISRGGNTNMQVAGDIAVDIYQ